MMQLTSTFLFDGYSINLFQFYILNLAFLRYKKSGNNTWNRIFELRPQEMWTMVILAYEATSLKKPKSNLSKDMIILLDLHTKRISSTPITSECLIPIYIWYFMVSGQ